MENISRKRTRKTQLQSAILSSLEIAGLLTLAVVAPNVIQLFKNRYTDRSVKSAAHRLVKKGLIAFEESNGKKYLRLTLAGSQELHRQKPRVNKPRKWDQKWRLVIFDIAEPRKLYRRLLRQTLIEIGFTRLQDSVWVFPYDCEELILLLKADFGLGKEVLYIIADMIERDSEIRTHFKLPPP